MTLVTIGQRADNGDQDTGGDHKANEPTASVLHTYSPFLVGQGRIKHWIVINIATMTHAR